MFENTESGLMTDEGMRREDFNKVYEESPDQTEPTTPASSGKWALRDRLRSKVLWTAVAGFLISLGSILNVWAKIGITVEGAREIIFGFGQLLELFGVFNDPTNREGF